MRPLCVPLRPSPIGLGLLFVHALPVACVCGEGVPVWVRGFVGGLVLVSLLRCLLKVIGNWSRSLAVQATGGVFLLASAKAAEPVLVCVTAQSCLLGLMLLICWQDESGKTEDVCLLRDGFSDTDWRNLRKCLRWQVMHSSA